MYWHWKSLKPNCLLLSALIPLVILQQQHCVPCWAKSLIVDFLINGSGSVLFVKSMLCSDAAFILSDMLPPCPPAVLFPSDEATGKCFFIFKFQDMLRWETKTAINLRKTSLGKTIPAAFRKHKLHRPRKRILHYMSINALKWLQASSLTQEEAPLRAQSSYTWWDKKNM